MLLKRFTNYVLAHQWQALLITFLITFIPVFGVFGIIIAVFFTLRRGARIGGMFTLAASIPYLISFLPVLLNPEKAHSLMVWAAMTVAILSNLITWVLAVMLERKVNWSNLLQIAALAAVLVISVIHLINPDISDWWGKQLQKSYNEAHQTVSQVLKTPQSDAKEKTDISTETINITKQYATGLMITVILLNAILQLIVGCWWEAAIYDQGSLRKNLHSIRLSSLAGALFGASLIFSYLGNSVVLDIMPVLYLLFAVAGLSLIHYMFGLAKNPMTWFWLLVVYMLLIFSAPVSLIFLAFIALLDIGLDLRNRFKKV